MFKLPKAVWNLFSRSTSKADVRQDVRIAGDGNVVNQVVGTGSPNFIFDPSRLEEFTRTQLEYETRSGKYIPNVFIETREIKEFARNFAHPILFLQSTIDSLDRFDIENCNEYLASTGMPELPFPDTKDHSPPASLKTVNSMAENLIASLADGMEVAEKFKGNSHGKKPPYPIAEGMEHLYEERKYSLQGFGYGALDKLEKVRKELIASKSGVFILTGRAGQGKTNFVCDLVDTFLLRHGIPCAYFTGRKVGVRNAADLGDSIQQLISGGVAGSYEHLLDRISAYCDEIGKPFVLIIDGINEHPNVHEFSEQLEDLIERSLRVPNVKILLTCRSEFFAQRFGNLERSTFRDQAFFYESDNRPLDQRQYEIMVAAYFHHFQFNRDSVPSYVIEGLKEDVLLLRFFCEAYGSLDKADVYRQPEITGIYRDEIFGIYLEKKLNSAASRLDANTRASGISAARRSLEEVLRHILKFMVDEWIFGDMPVAQIPAALEPALFALLDEDLILRRDAPDGTGVFSEDEETINFTFDEFRDFLLANYLATEVFKNTPDAFLEVMGRASPENTQSFEGLKRFLFYVSRRVECGEFWNVYQTQDWYQDVYLREVFKLNTSLLREEDGEFILKCIETGDYLATHTVGELVLRWNPERDPVLNLELLLGYLGGVDDDVYSRLVISNFSGRSRGMLSAIEVFEFIRGQIVPTLAESTSSRATPLIRFLILLLPVGADALLESEGMQTFRLVLQKQTEFGINLLADSLSQRFDQHRPFVWRLLASVREQICDSHPLCELARGDAEVAGAIGREAQRFLGDCIDERV